MSREYQNYSFSVDAELLRELGERLVGKPHIALAELIKNSYDADATHVEIWYTGDDIEVVDDGHGMSRADFLNRWMRLGTTQKRVERYSPLFRRPLTGSKGVGRLAVQLLAHETTVRSTTPDGVGGVEANVDWRTIRGSADLESVTVAVREQTTSKSFANNSPHGVSVHLRHLTDNWDAASFAEVAQEIWALRPPFASDAKDGMSVSLYADDEKIEGTFDNQMSAILDIWNGRVLGELLPTGTTPPKVHGAVVSSFPEATDDEEAQLLDELQRSNPSDAGELLGNRYIRYTVELREGDSREFIFTVPFGLIDQMSFEVRTFNLQRRQPRGIRVADARDYLRRFGGVGIYDTGFRLPYYGASEDWLSIERDHARRLSRTLLLPEELRVDRGLLDLPSNSRLFGWVNVSTGHEEAAWREKDLPPRHALSIQVTRDRLVNNNSYQQLRTMVRTAIDLYAMEVAREKSKLVADRSKRSSVRSSNVLGSLAAVVTEAKDHLPPEVFGKLKTAVSNATRLTQESEREGQQYASLLGALATAGSTSLAYEHEISKQVSAIRAMREQLEGALPTLSGSGVTTVESVAAQLGDWIERAGGIRAVFGSLLTKESRERVESYRAKRVVRKIVADLAPLARGIPVDISGIPDSLMLPPATLPAWSSIFQNLIINAYNALQDAQSPLIRITGESKNGSSRIILSDNGVGVDLDSSSELWRPFERRLQLDPGRESAGLGGLGLGLTIVRMIGDQIGIHVAFVPPEYGMKTSVSVQWSEPQQ